jgi:hypothetical protein
MDDPLTELQRRLQALETRIPEPPPVPVAPPVDERLASLEQRLSNLERGLEQHFERLQQGQTAPQSASASKSWAENAGCVALAMAIVVPAIAFSAADGAHTGWAWIAAGMVSAAAIVGAVLLFLRSKI